MLDQIGVLVQEIGMFAQICRDILRVQRIHRPVAMSALPSHQRRPPAIIQPRAISQGYHPCPNGFSPGNVL
ncbi:hypothetical protein SAE02_45740 [Skermanella aerolata]|uniref:Uncharacterized protein n=1 Tax=Skermanella aerolata TaxID=393310 RepID=A0A512DVF7_9PROT|nr:hypothetical protein SAE02_45740 [Skermanella aerolata]